LNAAATVRYAGEASVSATLFIALLIGGIFAFDFIARWWRENAWRRRWRQRDDD
jgi:hypothetical protein